MVAMRVSPVLFPSRAYRGLDGDQESEGRSGPQSADPQRSEGWPKPAFLASRGRRASAGEETKATPLRRPIGGSASPAPFGQIRPERPHGSAQNRQADP